MQFETTERTLRDLIRAFHSGSILLPQFQRDYVWKPAQIRNLLDSLLHGFPIGGFYLWRPSGGSLDPKSRKGVLSVLGSEFHGYLIDGQQRLTSLEAAFGLYSGEDKGGEELRCYLDLAAPDDGRRRDTRLFHTYAGHRGIARRVDRGDDTLIPVGQLFEPLGQDLRGRTHEALQANASWSSERVQRAMDRLEAAGRMLDQHVPCTTIRDVTDADAVEVFSRLNKGGRPLRTGDVRAAELARGNAVSTLKSMREFTSRELPMRLGFGFSFAFRALVVFHRGTAQFSSLSPDWIEAPGPDGRNLAQSWTRTQRSLESALTFIDEEMGWCRRTLIPSANAIIVLAAAMDRGKKKPSAHTVRYYKRWLCLTAMRQVFQGSVETVLNRFLRSVSDGGSDPGESLVKALKRDERAPLDADEFYGYAQMWGPATQVLYAWLVDQGARDWLANELIGDIARTGNSLLPCGDLTVHHIFARKLVADQYGNSNEANCPANYSLISRSTNSEHSSKSPDTVINALTPDQREMSGVQFFGSSAGDRLKPDRFDEFCEWRASRISESINEWLGLDGASRTERRRPRGGS